MVDRWLLWLIGEWSLLSFFLDCLLDLFDIVLLLSWCEYLVDIWHELIALVMVGDMELDLWFLV
jgi:hypothetical protein